MNNDFNIFESKEIDNNSINEINSENNNNSLDIEEEEESSEESIDSTFINENIHRN